MAWILPAVLLSLSVPQEPVVAITITGAPGAVIDAGALGLGSGGFGKRVRKLEITGPGQFITPGGARVHANWAGVKLDFPSGRDLLITPSGFVHLRDGRQGGPFLYGLELILGDGSSIRLRRSPASGKGIEAVDVLVGRQVTRIWHRRGATMEKKRYKVYRGRRAMILGEGDAVYEAGSTGPILYLSRIVSPKGKDDIFPLARIAIDCDPLVRSMQLLPRYHPHPDASFPDLDVLAQELSRLARAVFPAGRKGLSVIGDHPLTLTAGGGFGLTMTPRGTGPMVLSLLPPNGSKPIVEWILGRRCRLELVRPDARNVVGQRYQGKGIALGTAHRWAISHRRSAQEALFAKQVVAALTVRPRPPSGQ